MILFPAIDMKEGQVVRLLKGDLDKVSVYGDSPLAQAQLFAEQGFNWLHMVDLNGATLGASVNSEPVKEICNNTKLKVQLGGGIRSLEQIESWLDAGVERVILGTVAQKNPALVREACREFSGKIVVGIDAREGKVALEGWLEQSEVDYIDCAKQFEDAGVSAIIFTDIGRDGALTGVNIDQTAALARAVSIPVIASGGLRGMEDIEALKAAREQFEGVIAGRALYDGRLDATQALAYLGQ